MREKYQVTSSALSARQQTRIQAQLSLWAINLFVHAKLLAHTIVAAHQALDACRHMQIHAWLSIRDSTCRYTPGSRYMPAQRDKRLALDACRHMQKHASLSVRANTCRHTLSPRHWQMNEDTSSALDTSQRAQAQAQLLIQANERMHKLSYRYKPTSAGTSSALDTCCLYTPTSHLELRANGAETRSALDAFQHMQAHT